MSTMRMRDLFPAFYHRFLPDFFQDQIPRETSAACQDCVMLPDPTNEHPGPDLTYSPASKCCTYFPDIPNYLVGAILAETDPTYQDAQTRLKNQIRAKISTSPFGLERPRKYTVLVHNTPDFFGKSQLLICPFFASDHGRCTLWPYLTATCRTWFCKYDRGQEGLEFWRDLRAYWDYLQKILSRYVLHQFEFAPERILRSSRNPMALTVEELDGRAQSPEQYAQAWGSWVDREEEFYQKAFEQVSALTPEIFNTLIGIGHTIRLNQVMVRHEKMINPDPPPYLKRNPDMRVQKTRHGTYIVSAYLPRDAVELTQRLYAVLDYFDGRLPVDAVIQSLAQQQQMIPDADLLLSLYHLRILIPSK